MRRTLFLIAPLALLGCSRPAAAPDVAPAPAVAGAGTQGIAGSEAASLQTPAIDPLFAAVAADAQPPSVMLNRYVIALLNRNRSASDAAWAIPPADPHRADDAAIRQLQGVRTLRLDSEPRWHATASILPSCWKCRCGSARSPRDLPLRRLVPRAAQC